MIRGAGKDARNLRADAMAMMRKILVGMALVAILGAVGASGYQLGKYLRERDRAADVRPD